MKQELLLFRQFFERFHKVPDYEWEKMVPLIRPVSIKKGQTWFRAGERVSDIGFVTRGILRTFYTQESGKEFTKGFAVENQLIAPYVALLTNQITQMNVEALEDTFLITLDYKELVKFYDGDICWQIIGRKISEGLLIQRERREYQLLMLSAKERLSLFESEFPTLSQRLSQYQIASYLGITAVALSRMKKN